MIFLDILGVLGLVLLAVSFVVIAADMFTAAWRRWPW